MAKKRHKLAGLDKKKFSKIKQEYHDIDYAHKLSKKELEYLNNFMEEDLGARMNHDGKKIYKKKTDKIKAFRRNNARNFDVYGASKAMGKVVDISVEKAVNVWENEYVNYNYEEEIINAIDKKRQLKK